MITTEFKSATTMTKSDIAWMNKRVRFVLEDDGNHNETAKITNDELKAAQDMMSVLITYNANLDSLAPNEFVRIFPGVKTRSLLDMKRDWYAMERMWVYLGCVGHYGHRWNRVREWLMERGPQDPVHGQYMIDLIKKFNTQIR
jgi:hypothetical protein